MQNPIIVSSRNPCLMLLENFSRILGCFQDLKYLDSVVMIQVLVEVLEKFTLFLNRNRRVCFFDWPLLVTWVVSLMLFFSCKTMRPWNQECLLAKSFLNREDRVYQRWEKVVIVHPESHYTRLNDAQPSSWRDDWEPEVTIKFAQQHDDERGSKVVGDVVHVFICQESRYTCREKVMKMMLRWTTTMTIHGQKKLL